MGYKTVYRDVMKTYEEARENANVLQQRRKDSLYTSIPRLAEIDSDLAALGLALVKQTLAGDEAGLSKTRDKAVRLEHEKSELLCTNHIPEGYLGAVYGCRNCQDTGYLPANPGEIVERCSCLKQRLIEAYYSLSNVKGILEEENFDNFDYRCFSPNIIEEEGISPQNHMGAVHRMATDFVNDFAKGFNNLLLYGAAGLGKTFICHCIAKDLLDAGYTVLYLTAPRLFKVIEDYRFNRDALKEPGEMIDAITDVDLLILDDLGAEFMTVVTSSALFDLVNQRLLAKKPMVISTNLPPDELVHHYSARIVSRFTGYYRMIKFIGEDIRVKKKYGGRYAAV
ncbi:MAG: ATP-binding protein [Defluviitaleaceae bacterium]|nr:ATP-binding protein [Defluviitaleaceae bacterium]